MEKNKELSREIKERNGYQMGMCFKNAAMSVVEIPEAKYVEGQFVLIDSDVGKNLYIPITHGWIETKEGEVIDPTLPDDEGVYVKARDWSHEELLDELEKDNVLPIMSYREKDYIKAEVEALSIASNGRLKLRERSK